MNWLTNFVKPKLSSLVKEKIFHKKYGTTVYLVEI